MFQPGEQQNDHCILRFKGEQWRITLMRGLDCIVVRNVLWQNDGEVLDLSKVDWPAYTTMAAAALAGKMPIWDIEFMAKEVVQHSGGSTGTIYCALRDAYRMGVEGIDYDELKRRQAAEREQWAREHPEGDVGF